MKRQVKIGPEKIDGTLGPIREYLNQVHDFGSPDEAKVHIETSPADGSLLVSVEYEDEVGG